MKSTEYSAPTVLFKEAPIDPSTFSACVLDFQGDRYFATAGINSLVQVWNFQRLCRPLARELRSAGYTERNLLQYLSQNHSDSSPPSSLYHALETTVLDARAQPVLSLAFAPFSCRKRIGIDEARASAGSLLAIGLANGCIVLYDTEKDTVNSAKAAHRGGVLSIAFHPNEPLFCTGATDGTAKLWDLHSRMPLLTLRGHVGPVRRVIFSPDGGWIFTVDSAGTLRVWNPFNEIGIISSGEPLLPISTLCPPLLANDAGSRDMADLRLNAMSVVICTHPTELFLALTIEWAPETLPFCDSHSLRPESSVAGEILSQLTHFRTQICIFNLAQMKCVISKELVETNFNKARAIEITVSNDTHVIYTPSSQVKFSPSGNILFLCSSLYGNSKSNSDHLPSCLFIFEWEKCLKNPESAISGGLAPHDSFLASDDTNSITACHKENIQRLIPLRLSKINNVAGYTYGLGQMIDRLQSSFISSKTHMLIDPSFVLQFVVDESFSKNPNLIEPISQLTFTLMYTTNYLERNSLDCEKHKDVEIGENKTARVALAKFSLSWKDIEDILKSFQCEEGDADETNQITKNEIEHRLKDNNAPENIVCMSFDEKKEDLSVDKIGDYYNGHDSDENGNEELSRTFIEAFNSFDSPIRLQDNNSQTYPSSIATFTEDSVVQEKSLRETIEREHGKFVTTLSLRRVAISALKRSWEQGLDASLKTLLLLDPDAYIIHSFLVQIYPLLLVEEEEVPDKCKITLASAAIICQFTDVILESSTVAFVETGLKLMTSVMTRYQRVFHDKTGTLTEKTGEECEILARAIKRNMKSLKTAHGSHLDHRESIETAMIQGDDLLTLWFDK